MGGESGEDRIYKFCLGLFMVVFGLNYIYPHAPFVGVLVFLASLFAVVLILKGLYEFVFKDDDQSFTAGTMLAFILILFFGGLPFIIAAFKVCAGVVLGLLSVFANIAASVL